MRNDIVTQTRAYLEIDYLVVFALALMYGKLLCNRDNAERELNRWKKTGKVPQWLEDFCLSVLSRRMVVRWDVRKPQNFKLLEGGMTEDTS